MKFPAVSFLLLAACLTASADEPSPKTPAESLAAIHTRPDMQVDLAVCEPLIQDPVAIAWGPDGRLWVAEMGDYPLGADGRGKPDGRVRVLADTDGDGRYDTSTIFLEGLSYPTGVMPWYGSYPGQPSLSPAAGALGDAVIVTCAPDLFIAADTDGDGRADRREVLFTGFPKRNQQHRVNGLRWGLDNWVHCANGDGGVGEEARIECVKTGRTMELGGRDFRFRPETGELDPQSGKTQFGRYPDDWGQWFGCNNAQPLYHFVLADHYLRRNPRLAPLDPRVQVVPGASGPLYGLAHPVTVRGTPAERRDVYVTGFTSACSAAVYRDDLLGREFRGNVFVCDPATSLVHRRVLDPRGITFSSRRADDEGNYEFFASRDAWTRPVMAVPGPDGALWVVDMYRLIIEHPQWIDPAVQQRVDLRSGHDRGRIWRVYPRGKSPRPLPRLERFTTAELVAALDSPSGWQRDMAQQMLLWRNEQSAAAPLRTMAQASANPLARLHALCTLDGLGQLDAGLLLAALADKHPGVRRHGVRLCEAIFSSDGDQAKLADALIALATDPDPGVQLQLAFTLGELDDPRVTDALASLTQADDPYLSAAVLSSLEPDRIPAMFSAVVQADTPSGPPLHFLEQLLAMAKFDEKPEPLASLIDRIGTPPFAVWQFAALSGVLTSLQRDSEGNDKRPPALPAPMHDRVAGLWSAALKLAANDAASLPDRLVAVRLLGHSLPGGALAGSSRNASDTVDRDVAVLAVLLTPQTPLDVQHAAAHALGSIDDPRAARSLLAAWAGYSPALRGRVLDAILSRATWVESLFEEISAGRIPAGELDASRRGRLLAHPEARLRERAQEVLTGANTGDRSQLVDEYRSALALSGDAARGKAVFERRCAACHRLDGVGHQVGPDLAAWANKPADDLLIAVLDPNRAVEPRYVAYVLATREGRLFSGVLAGETAHSITLLAADGQPQTFLRADIDALRSTGKSLMPDGLEKDLPPQDFADLSAHLRRKSDR